MTIYILKLSIFGFTFVKKIDILTQLKNCLMEEFQVFKKNNPWMFTRILYEFKKNVRLTFRINDNMDVCAKIKQNRTDNVTGRDTGRDKKTTEKMNTIYYYEHCGMSLDRNKLNQLK